MAPARRRGANNKAKDKKSQLSVGDLVLAKVKGFPAWPAKVLPLLSLLLLLLLLLGFFYFLLFSICVSLFLGN